MILVFLKATWSVRSSMKFLDAIDDQQGNLNEGSMAPLNIAVGRIVVSVAPGWPKT